MSKLSPDEMLLESVWSVYDDQTIDNGVSERINWLIKNLLIEIEKYNSGWVRFFVDPTDGRHWELDYPENELHGGGPPRLRVVNRR